jgi:UDP-GlcNAc3NAcA epimerase
MREERNRVRVDHLSEWLLCPTPTAVTNLEKEGVTRNVHHVGDVMYDAALRAREKVEALGSDHFKTAAVESGESAVATVHRAETTDDPAKLASVLEYLDTEAAKLPEGAMRLPLHPRTRKAIDAAGLSTGRLAVLDPVGYLEMTHLVMTASVVYTDSGGLQKEAYFHRVPCVTLRSETEWGETIDAGWNRLWTEPTYRPRREILDYGDGHAGRHIAELLAQELGVR